MAKTETKSKDEMLEDKGDDVFVIRNVRLSYENLHAPRAFAGGGAPRYSVQLMLDKEEHDDSVSTIRAAYQKELEARKLKCPSGKWCIKDGDDAEDKPEYAGHWIISASATEDRPPKLYGIDGKATSAKDDIYSGAYGNAHVRFWIQNNDYGVRVNCQILGMRATEEGDRFGSAPPDSAGALGATDDDDPFADGEG